MKKTQAVPKRSQPARVASSIPAQDEDHQEAVESPQLSPERINAQAAATTDLLREILARQDAAPELRYWGINE